MTRDAASPSTCFIGAGNMATSLVRGLLDAGHPPRRLSAADPDAGQRTALGALGVHSTDDNNAAAAAADVVVLAVKPQVLGAVVAGLRPIFAERRPLVMSIAAGIPLATLERWCGDGVPVVRAMPNTPALLGQGVTALAAGAHVDSTARATAGRIAAAVGAVHWVADDAMDAVTAVSGSGPAWAFALAEAMTDTGVALGLPRDTAGQLAAHTLLGAGRMLVESGDDAAELRRKVTSPRGTTEAGLAALDAAGFAQVVAGALRAAAARSAALARELDADPAGDATPAGGQQP